MSARPMFLRGHNGRLRLVQSEGMHLVTTTAEGVSDRAVPFVTSTGLVIGGAHTRPAPLPGDDERAVQRALLNERTPMHVADKIVLCGCAAAVVALGVMRMFGVL